MPGDQGKRADVALGPVAAVALVFGSSAAVLVVELVALRLLAPHLGLTLETSTLVIGLALAAIAFGSWTGGQLADRVPPQRMLGPMLAVSGAAVALTPFVVRSTAAAGDPALLVVVAGAAVLVPGAALSAVTPMVTKLRLSSLDETGTVVGRLSGIGTAGAIAGTVVTGFVLISRVPVSVILVGLGVVLVAASALVEGRVRGLWAGAWPTVLVLVGGLLAAASPDVCDVETTYHCAEVRVDPVRDGGRTLVLDGVRHSYVDLDDPTHLEFDYIRAVAAAVDVTFRTGDPLRAYHLGGGGLTLPRFLAEVRPGTDNLVSEIDAGVVRLDRDRLALTDDVAEVRVEDGRLGVERLADESRDLVVGDAFGGVSVPWHLTTREAATQVRRVLAPRGVYAMNLIDFGDLAFARAAVVTLTDVFDHVLVLAEPETLEGARGGNLVAVAADRPLPVDDLAARLDARGTGWSVAAGAELREWAGDAEVLTDDWAPVDQLLTPYDAR